MSFHQHHRQLITQLRPDDTSGGNMRHRDAYTYIAKAVPMESEWTESTNSAFRVQHLIRMLNSPHHQQSRAACDLPMADSADKRTMMYSTDSLRITASISGVISGARAGCGIRMMTALLLMGEAQTFTWVRLRNSPKGGCDASVNCMRHVVKKKHPVQI